LHGQHCDGGVKPVVASGVNALGGGCRWLDSSSGFLCNLIQRAADPGKRAGGADWTRSGHSRRRRA
jgi:hypothetical protein